MKTIFSFCFILLLCTIAKAEHITGGEMFYTYVGLVNGEHVYRGTVKLYKNCHSSRQLANPAVLSVFDRLTGARLKDVNLPLNNTETISLTDPNKCITDPPDVCYTIGYYYFEISVPASSNGYILSCQFVYRINGINNLNSGYGNVGATYTAEIPGTTALANHSARFTGNDMVAVCANNSFSYSFAAKDDDGDQLKYRFCDAYQGGSGGAGNVNPSAPPPFYSVPYGSGFSGTTPLGGNVKIDENTGLIKGIAPGEGVYVVTVCVDEYRNGVLIATQRKDLQINIASCTIAAASLLPEYLLCKDSKTLQLTNISTSPLVKTYSWELSNSEGAVIFSQTTPTISYTFADTGIYKIKLVINKDLECSDSMNSTARVYPGLKTDFDYQGVCFKKPTVFTNETTTVYGQLNYWKWDFGEYNNGDITTEFSPTYQYQSMGYKGVQLMVGTTKGCRDTITDAINILEKPPMTMSFRDTLICVKDKVQLGASAPGGGSFTWSPDANMLNSTTSNPIVSPNVTTTYYALLDDNGCLNRDSVKVRVTDKVFLQAMNDTTICQGDPVQLALVSDGFTYSWTNITPEDAALPNPVTVTNKTTIYEVTAFIGGCFAKDQVVINTVPYPVAYAGTDTVICYKTTAKLSGATDGNSVVWSPAFGLNQADILEPTVLPKQTTNYVLTAYDTKGCPKPGRDTVLVTVLPDIKPFAGRDTAVVVGQSLQLNATGGISYSWSPSFGLSATDVSDPLATYSAPNEGIKYKVVIFNEAGCADSAYVNVKVFGTDAMVFVPDAFTPNGDGKNDKVRPIAAGMKQIEYFNIYNRWGQLVFSTQSSNNGWDGTIGGQIQNTGVFIWVVKAVDYKGKSYFQKGTVTLIR